MTRSQSHEGIALDFSAPTRIFRIFLVSDPSTFVPRKCSPGWGLLPSLHLTNCKAVLGNNVLVNGHFLTVQGCCQGHDGIS